MSVLLYILTFLILQFGSQTNFSYPNECHIRLSSTVITMEATNLIQIRKIYRIRKVKCVVKRSTEIMSDRDNSGLYRCRMCTSVITHDPLVCSKIPSYPGYKSIVLESASNLVSYHNKETVLYSIYSSCK